MADKTQVKAELVLDSNADDVAKELRKDFTQLREDVAKAQSGFKDFGSTLAALTVHDMLMPALRGARDLVTGSLELAGAADTAQHHIAGMMAGMAGTEWEVARGGATVLHDKMTALAIDSGQVKETLLGAHQALRTFLGGDAAAFDVATRNMGNLNTISMQTGIGLGEMGMQFGKMAAGFVSMESPVFNLLKGTGIFSNDITKINAEWQKLTSEERIKRLETAVGGVAANLGKAAPSMHEMLSSMKETGVAFLESFGGAVMSEMVDELQNLREELVAADGQFENFSESLGKDLGKELAQIINQLIEAAQYFRENGDEIADNIKEAFQFAKETVQFLVSNSKLIVTMAGAAAVAKKFDVDGSTAMDFGKGLLGKGAKAAAGAEGAAPALSLASKAGQAVPAFIGAIIAGGPPVWAATAAVTALGGALAYLAHEGSKEEKKQRERIAELMKKEHDRFRELHELTAEEHAQRTRDMKELIALAHELGEETQALRKFKAVGADNRQQLDKYVTPYTTSAANFDAMSKEQMTDPMLLQETQGKAVEDMVAGLANSVKSGDVAVTQALLTTLQSNDKLMKAFLNSADVVKIGADGLAMSLEALENMSVGGSKGALGNLLSGALAEVNTPKGVSVNMNGGQTFKIQQDFRDQDPDRLAVTFMGDLKKAAISRVQASTSAPFGA